MIVSNPIKGEKYLVFIGSDGIFEHYYYTSKRSMNRDIRKKLDSKWYQKPYYIFKLAGVVGS